MLATAPRAHARSAVVIETVRFAGASASIDEKSHALLEEVARILEQHPQVTKLRVEGHTDSLGPRAANQRLSQARAEAVVDFLVQRGVAAERLVPVGFGESRPLASNRTAEGRAKNRRVEFHILELGSR